MGEPRPFASLSSGLLARKGAAKPAMRPQGFGALAGLEDLGWNDMGHQPRVEEEPQPHHVPSSIAALTPAPRAEEAPALQPPVVEQQRAIAERFAEEPREEASAPSPAKDRVPAKAKAAFTLRLDADRHLRLRLASAVTGRSAQKIVTEALDALLDRMDDVDALAMQVPARARGK